MLSKSHHSKILFSAITFTVIAALSACSRGTSRPQNWKPSDLLKAECMSPYAFNVNKMNEYRQSKMSKAPLLMVETKEILDSKIADELQVPKEVTMSLLTLAEFEQSSEKINIEKNCQFQKVTYMGPGVDQPVSGDLVEITEKSITFSVEGKGGVADIYKVELDLPKRKLNHDAYKEALRKSQEGESTIIVNITRTLNSAPQTTTTYRQESRVRPDVAKQVDRPRTEEGSAQATSVEATTAAAGSTDDKVTIPVIKVDDEAPAIEEVAAAGIETPAPVEDVAETTAASVVENEVPTTTAPAQTPAAPAATPTQTTKPDVVSAMISCDEKCRAACSDEYVKIFLSGDQSGAIAFIQACYGAGGPQNLPE